MRGALVFGEKRDNYRNYWSRTHWIADLVEELGPRAREATAEEAGEATTTGLVQAHLAESHVAKGFSHLLAADITVSGLPAGSENRRALATASNHEEAAVLVAKLYDEFGFDTVNIGSLAESWRVERGRPAYMVRQNARELSENLAKAARLI